MASAGSSEQELSPEESSPEQSSTASGKRPAIVLVTVAGVLVGILALVVGLVVPRVFGGGEPDGTRDVVQRAEDFAVTYNTYDVAEKDEYQERMRELLTPEYYEEFKRITDAVFSALDSQDQTSGDARVLATAIESIDDENAVALVAVNAAISTSEDEAAVQRRFRWKVTFARTDGEWRVSQFEQVVPADAELGEAGEQGGLVPGTDEEAPQGEQQEEGE